MPRVNPDKLTIQVTEFQLTGWILDDLSSASRLRLGGYRGKAKGQGSNGKQWPDTVVCGHKKELWAPPQ